jgi:hypothetical protein
MSDNIGAIRGVQNGSGHTDDHALSLAVLPRMDGSCQSYTGRGSRSRYAS